MPLFRILLFLLLTFALGTPTRAQDVRCDAQLSTTLIRVGEQLQLDLTLSCNANAQVKFPNFDSGSIVKGVEVLECGAIDTLSTDNGKRWKLSRRYTLTSFDSAVYRFPPLSVLVNGKRYPSKGRLTLKVDNVVVDTKNSNNIRPAHAVVEGDFVWSWEYPLLCVALFGAVIVFILCIARLSQRRLSLRRVVIFPAPPPHRRALEDMKQLQAQTSPTEGEQKLYFMQLTDILRQYLKARFHINASEMTTAEILNELKAQNDATDFSALRNILNTADFVKFAQYKTSASESELCLKQAETYVSHTKIDDPEAEKPRIEEQPYEAHVQRAIRLVVSGISVLSAIAVGGLFVYICYQLYQDFA